MTRTSIVLVNQQPILLDGLVNIFAANAAFKIAAASGRASDTLKLVTLHNPEVIVLDPSELKDVFSTISSITRISQGTRIVAFSASENVDQAVRGLDAGAAAYVSTNGTADELFGAIGAVLNGDTFISPSVATKVVAVLRASALRKAAIKSRRLSVREEQIVNLLMKGKSNKEIAISLGLREKTIKHYMSILMQKLQARSRLEVALALRPHDNSATFLDGAFLN